MSDITHYRSRITHYQKRRSTNGNFFLFGKYTSDTIKAISVKRTEQAIDIIKELGGEVKGVYALLGEYDLLFCINVPDIEAAMKASVGLTRLTGISFSTCPAVKVEIFDSLATE